MTIKIALERAVQLAEIAGEWGLTEVEIDGQMVRTRDLVIEFQRALSESWRSGSFTRGEIIDALRNYAVVLPTESGVNYYTEKPYERLADHLQRIVEGK